MKLILSPVEASAALGVTSGTLATKLGYHSIGYQIADLEQWVASRRVSEGRPS